MRFGIERCTILVLKRGLGTMSERMSFPDESIIQALRDGEGYKYLDVLEASGVLHGQMKQKISKEHFRRVRKIAQSRLNDGNITKALITWAVSLVWYAGEIVQRRKQELRGLDRRTRKLLTMNGGFYSIDCVARFYVPRAEGGRGLSSVEDCFEQAEKITAKVCPK